MHRHIPLLPSFAKRYGFNHRTYNMNSVWSLRNINLAIDDISCHSRNNSLLGSQVQVADISQQRFNSGGNASNWKNSMSDAMKSVEDIVTQLSDLPSSNLFEAPSLDAIEKLRLVEDRLPRALFVKGKGLFRSLENNVTRGNVRPSGKHGVQISKFLERILIVYNHVSIIRHTFDRTNEDGDKLYVYDECVRILDWMEQRNLNWRSHCELAISCACHEDRFDDAASLFWNLIDPEAGGHPTEVAVDNPLGLFAVARSCQDQGLPAAEHVFDAVLRLSMVSPIDQPTYVLAAGVALGHAGEWEASVQYLRNNSSSQELGFALVASVMRTCLLCDRPTEAWKIYEEFVEHEMKMAGEWQWGGGRDRRDPLCRDLAMQSMATLTGKSATGVDFFLQTLEEDVTVSQEALLGVIGACECDGNWEEAVSLLQAIFENFKKPNWIVSASEMMISDRHFSSSVDESQNSSNSSRITGWLGGVLLASVMRTCNSSSKYGTSLILCRLLDFALPSLAGNQLREYPKSRGDSKDSTLEESLFHMLMKMQETDDALISCMIQSLCGLACFRSAANMFEMMMEVRGSDIDTEMEHTTRVYYERALEEIAQREEKLVGSSWHSANRHIHRLTAAISKVKSSKVLDLQDTDRQRLENALAAAMQACTDANQPQASLFLAQWTETTLDCLDDANGCGARITMSDSVLAETIYAHRWNGGIDEAAERFESLLELQEVNFSQWKLSCVAGLSVLVASGRIDDAFTVFNRLGSSGQTVDGFIIIARGLSRGKRWLDVYDLYRSAHGLGCLSDDIGLMAMRAVANSDTEGKMNSLRAVVDDTADAAGTDPIQWMESRYLNVKRAVGFNYTSLLLWWSDPNTRHLDELDLILEEFEKRKLSGLRVKQDVARLILKHAQSFHPEYVPNERVGLPRVPRTKEHWRDVLINVVQEAHQTSLLEDPTFVEDVVRGFEHLDCNPNGVLSDLLPSGIAPNIFAASTNGSRG